MATANPTYLGSKFTWDNGPGYDGPLAWAEASALDLPPGVAPHSTGKPDSVGFYVLSHRTGRKEFFTYRETVYDDDGSIRHWSYASAAGLKLTVFNA